MWSPSLVPIFIGTLLDILATTTSSATMLYLATFGVFPLGFSAVWLLPALPFRQAGNITALLLLFLEKARTEFPDKSGQALPSLCRAVCNHKSGCLLHLYLSGSLPPRFYHSKSYFRHLNKGSLTFNSSVLTIQSLILQTIMNLLWPWRSVPIREPAWR